MRLKTTWRTPPTIAREAIAGNGAVSGETLKAAADEALVGVAGEVQPFARLGADAERVDQHEMSALRFGDDVVEEGLAGGVQAVGPATFGGPGLEHELARAGDDDVVGREEALFLVGELLVEGSPRDARQPDHVRDGRAVVAALGDRLDHPAVEACALMSGDVLAIETVRPVRQSPVQRRWIPLSRSL